MRLAVTACLLAGAIASQAFAYSLVVRREGGEFVRLRWAGSAQPILFAINDQVSPELPNITDDSDPIGALNRALSRWPSFANISITSGFTSVASGGIDGRNIITFADTEANREIFEMGGGGGIALTLFAFRDGRLIEADILFSPDRTFTTTIESQTELELARMFDIEGVAFHEIGHAIGLDHTGVESATMWTRAALSQRLPDSDDIAGLRTLYPLGGNGGAIRGSVRVGGAAAFGAHVVALSADGIPTSALTLPDGTYAIENLTLGSYTVYVEPLDGPHSSSTTDPCARYGNLSNGGIYGAADLTTDFPTTFLGGNELPTLVTVDGTNESRVDFELSRGANTVNPVLIGDVPNEVARIPLAVTPGTVQTVAVAGPGVDRISVSGVSIAGEGVVVDSRSVSHATIFCNEQELPAFTFQALISLEAAPGGRSILLRADGKLSAMTGALRIGTAPSGPFSCVGDCNEDREITVDELVQGVGIALGDMSVDVCPPADDDDDGQVVVSELLQAVTAALSGCQS
jgi:hypothetical protein